MSGAVDVRAVLRQIADGEGDGELLALQAHDAVAELMAEAQRVVDGTTDDLHYLRAALARVGGAA